MSLELIDSLAVRNRPQQFSDIVGNSVNINSITGFLKKGQLPRTFGFFGEPGSGKCIIGESLVLTNKGLEYIKDFTNTTGFTQKEITVFTKNGFQNTSHVYMEENVDVIEIETEHGYNICGTPEHPVQILTPNTEYEWKKLQDITTNDIIVLRSFMHENIGEIDNVDCMYGRFFALLLVCYNPITNWMTFNKKLYKELQDLHRFLYPDVKLKEIYDGVILPKDLRIPKSFFVWKEFYTCLTQLLTYQDTIIYDGVFTFDNSRIAKEFQVLLLTLGVITHRVYNRVEIIFYDYSNISKDEETLFSILSTKEYNISGDVYSKVVKIRKGGKETVYDVTEPSTHSFIANGIINHNTTTARLLAMTVNCQNIGKSIQKGIVEPCGECTSCKLAIKNQHPDIRELNAGGEEGNVDSIRRVLQDLKISPRFNTKVFILDECLPGDTQVLLPNGKTETIKNIVENSNETSVISFNTETKELEECKIINKGKNNSVSVFSIELEDGTVQRCSNNHKWWSVTRQQYIRTDELIEGEELLVIEEDNG